MTATFIAFAALAWCAADPGDERTPRKPNQFAPSLPQLTDEEEDAFDQTIDRFILFDTGRLPAEEGKQALAEFRQLGPEAIPALIRGLNRAAKIEGSCPAVTIARKLRTMLAASNDRQLMDFARENIGAGITRSRHMTVLRDLRVYCMMRKRAIPEDAEITPVAPVRESTFRAASPSQILLEAAESKPARREQLLKELDRRPAADVLRDAATVATDATEEKARQVAREALRRCLSRQGGAALKKALKHDLPEVRAAAAAAVAEKRLHYEAELIDLLEEERPELREAGHRALVRLNPGTDFGPERDAALAERAAAVRKWRAWLDKQDNR